MGKKMFRQHWRIGFKPKGGPMSEKITIGVLICNTFNLQQQISEPFSRGTKPSFPQLSLSLVNPRKDGPFP